MLSDKNSEENVRDDRSVRMCMRCLMTWPKAMRMLPRDDELDGEWKSALEAPCFLQVKATPRSPLWMA